MTFELRMGDSDPYDIISIKTVKKRHHFDTASPNVSCVVVKNQWDRLPACHLLSGTPTRHEGTKGGGWGSNWGGSLYTKTPREL
jgi:hypothetical protein